MPGLYKFWSVQDTDFSASCVSHWYFDNCQIPGLSCNRKRKPAINDVCWAHRLRLQQTTSLSSMGIRRTLRSVCRNEAVIRPPSSSGLSLMLRSSAAHPLAKWTVNPLNAASCQQQSDPLLPARSRADLTNPASLEKNTFWRILCRKLILMRREYKKLKSPPTASEICVPGGNTSRSHCIE